MTDHELLGLAAKAYWGDEIDDVCSVEWSEPDQAIAYMHADNQDHNGLDRWLIWNPLEDDGDALRLAVKLRINIEHQTTMGGKPVGFNVWPVGRGDCGSIEDASDEAALRRAIVRVAAAIGATGAAS